MTTVDIETAAGRSFPAGRTTFNLVGGASPLQTSHFSFGYVVLDAHGGQIPWHSHEQEEVYFVLEGEGEMCVDAEVRRVRGGELVHIPSNAYHQLTNVGDNALRLVYCYAPAGEVAHWRQELEGTLPRAGVGAPALPEGATPQRTATF